MTSSTTPLTVRMKLMWKAFLVTKQAPPKYESEEVPDQNFQAENYFCKESCPHFTSEISGNQELRPMV